VRFSGLEGVPYCVERSDDLMTWTDLGSPTGPAPDFEFSEIVPGAIPSCYYRIVTTVLP
jgi:hypothetical protein